MQPLVASLNPSSPWLTPNGPVWFNSELMPEHGTPPHQMNEIISATMSKSVGVGDVIGQREHVCPVLLDIRRILRASELDPHEALGAIAEICAKASSTCLVPPEPQPQSFHESIVQRAKHFLHTNFAAPCCPSIVADYCGVSIRRLTADFRHEYGLTTTQYVKRVRIRHAIAFLLTTEDKLSAIAERAGFGSVSSLQRALRSVKAKPGRRTDERPARLVDVLRRLDLELVGVAANPRATISDTTRLFRIV